MKLQKVTLIYKSWIGGEIPERQDVANSPGVGRGIPFQL